MKLPIRTALLTGFLALAAATAAPRPAPIWSGQSGGFTWTWTAADLQARRTGGGAAFSLVAPVRAEVLKYARENRKKPGTRRETHHAYSPLSLVGTLLSYEDAHGEDWEGEPHPFALTSYRVVDVARPGRKVRLTDYFPDREVLAALVKDPVVREAMASIGIRGASSAAALVKRLAEENADIQDGTYAFQVDQLARFAFHHLEGDRVAVRLGISHGAEVSRGMLTQIGILLPVPAALRADLRRAAAGQAGFLMRERARRFGDRETSFDFTFTPEEGPRKGAPEKG